MGWMARVAGMDELAGPRPGTWCWCYEEGQFRVTEHEDRVEGVAGE